MGLRFRKSISLCKGVRLNFGKTGTSISVGGKGYRKTINTKGQVTTSVGIPGTGIYYTDTKSLKKDKSTRLSSSRNEVRPQDYLQSSNVMLEDNASTYKMNSEVENYFASSSAEAIMEATGVEDIEMELEPIEEPIISIPNISLSDILNLYTRCDEAVDWTEILVSTSAEELFMNNEIWKYYKSVADKVLHGDIDTYLQVIEKIRPLDDLLAYGGDFEFGTEDSTVMEVEFNVMPEDVLGDNYSEDLLQEYVCACSIRVARDIMALLPVTEVIVHTVMDEKCVLSVEFNKEAMMDLNYNGMKAIEIICDFKHFMEIDKNGKFVEVSRIE